MEVKHYTAQQLKSELNKNDLWNSKYCPITRHRALSIIMNPRTQPDDPVLIVGYNKGEVSGYVAIVPDVIYSGDELVKLGWLGSWWSDPDPSNSMMAVLLLRKAYDVYDGFLAGFSAAERAEQLIKSSNRFEDFVHRIRGLYPEAIICAGNVVTNEMTEQLIIAGADIVKVGIGPGSMCTTRMQTGVGYPQLSAVIECADAAHGLGGHICADGGCRLPSDVAKAFGGGADFVMLGGMFSGHFECGGAVVDNMMEFYGMSSKIAMDKHSGGVAEYRSSEGRSQLVPFRGPVDETVMDILGGLRSTCTYVGASKLKELSKRTTFVRVNRTHEPFSNGGKNE